MKKPEKFVVNFNLPLQPQAEMYVKKIGVPRARAAQAMAFAFAKGAKESNARTMYMAFAREVAKITNDLSIVE